MKHPVALLFFCCLALLTASCTRSPEPAPPSTPAQSGTPPMLFRFDYTDVQEVLISKAHPQSGDRWTARLRHTAPGATHWELESGPDGAPMLDRMANGNLIEHLLDTLRTLQVGGLAPKGPLESFGLKPPVYAIRWKAAGTEFEIHFGAEQQGKTFAVIPKQGHGKGSEQVLQVHGAALRMLAHIENFQVLRFPTWSTLTTDDIDTIEIRDNGAERFFAEREGHNWVGKKRKPLPKKLKSPEIEARLEELTHSRIESYVDDAARAAELKKIAIRPRYEAIFTDRQGRSVSLKLFQENGRLFGTSSSRPDGVFGFYPKLLEVIQQFFTG